MSQRLIRNLVMVASLFLLVSCGFSPLYQAPQNRAPSSLPPVAIETINDHDGHQGRDGQMLRTALEDRLNRGNSGTPSYRLAATFEKTLVPVVIERDGSITRYNINMVSHFQLFRQSDAKQVHAGTIKRVGSYNVSNQDFSTFMAQKDATERGIIEIAEDYRLKLGAWFAQHP